MTKDTLIGDDKESLTLKIFSDKSEFPKVGNSDTIYAIKIRPELKLGELIEGPSFLDQYRYSIYELYDMVIQVAVNKFSDQMTRQEAFDAIRKIVLNGCIDTSRFDKVLFDNLLLLFKYCMIGFSQLILNGYYTDTFKYS